MEVLKGTVIQAKKLDNFESKGKKFYPWGILIKLADNKTVKGQYYCLEDDQNYFTEGKEVTFTYKPHKEVAKSAILPAVKRDDSKPTQEQRSSKSNAENKPGGGYLSKDEYTRRKMIDTASFTASYVCKMLENEKPEDAIKFFPLIADVVHHWQIEKIRGIE